MPTHQRKAQGQSPGTSPDLALEAKRSRAETHKAATNPELHSERKKVGKFDGDEPLVVFADDLPYAFIARFELRLKDLGISSPERLKDVGKPTPEQFERLAGFMYKSRLSTEEVAAVLCEVGAPEPWVNLHRASK